MFIRAETLWIVTLAERTSDRIHFIVRDWTQSYKRTIGLQLVRAADSVGANIIEGCGRQHRLDSLRFLYIARGSLDETRYWIRRAVQRDIIPELDGRSLETSCERISQGLSHFITFRRSQK